MAARNPKKKPTVAVREPRAAHPEPSPSLDPEAMVAFITGKAVPAGEEAQASPPPNSSRSLVASQPGASAPSSTRLPVAQATRGPDPARTSAGALVSAPPGARAAPEHPAPQATGSSGYQEASTLVASGPPSSEGPESRPPGSKGVVARRKGPEQRRLTAYVPLGLGAAVLLEAAKRNVDISTLVTEALCRLLAVDVHGTPQR